LVRFKIKGGKGTAKKKPPGNVLPGSTWYARKKEEGFRGKKKGNTRVKGQKEKQATSCLGRVKLRGRGPGRQAKGWGVTLKTHSTPKINNAKED